MLTKNSQLRFPRELTIEEQDKIIETTLEEICDFISKICPPGFRCYVTMYRKDKLPPLDLVAKCFSEANIDNGNQKSFSY
jgi:hypothetical protein